jgi:hypothetical protein
MVVFWYPAAAVSRLWNFAAGICAGDDTDAAAMELAVVVSTSIQITTARASHFLCMQALEMPLAVLKKDL